MRLSRRLTSEYTVKSCFVGKETHCLNKVSVDVCIVEAVPLFGPFVKYMVEASSNTVCSSGSAVPKQLNAFDILMSSQQSLSAISRIPARTRKDDLYNALSEFFEEKNLLLPKGDDGGERLLKSLVY